MPTEIVIPKNTYEEIVPASPIVLDRWRESLSDMDTVGASIEAVTVQAQTFEVKDQAAFELAGERIAELKRLTEESEACMQPFKIKVHRVLDFIQQRFNKNKNRAEEGRAIYSAKMGDYSRKEKEATAKEQKRLDRKGIEGTVQPNIPKTAVRQTTNYPIEVADRSKFLNAFLRANTERRKFLAQFIALDESALRAHAKELKDPVEFMKQIPGVKCEAKDAFGGKV